MTFDPTRASASAAAVIALVGFAFVFRPAEAAVADRYAQIDLARSALARSATLIGRIPALEHDRTHLAAQLERFHVRDRPAVLIERFLDAVARAAARDDVSVERVAAGVRPPVTAPAPMSQPALPLDDVPLDVTVRGRYADLIRAVRDLNAGDFSARIAVTSIGDVERRPGAPLLVTAALHITLLRENQ